MVNKKKCKQPQNNQNLCYLAKAEEYQEHSMTCNYVLEWVHGSKTTLKNTEDCSSCGDLCSNTRCGTRESWG